MNTRPTSDDLEAARAAVAHHAHQVEQADRRVDQALRSVAVAMAVGGGLAWALLAWADCTASGAAMCTMAITPTRPNLWRRLVRAVRAYVRQWHIRWAEDDVRYLEEDLEAAQAWVMAAPAVIAHRRALLDALRVQAMSEDLDSRAR